MRIRKHAKVSPLVYASSSGTVVKSNECQLNQSPWDVITFSSSDPYATPQPPNLFQANGDGNFLGNESFGDSIGAVESVASMKLSWNDEKDMRDYNAPKWGCSDGIAVAEGVENGHEDAENGPADIKTVERLGLKNDTQIASCGEKTDGKKCKRKADYGEALKEQHLIQLNDNTTNNLAQTIAEESDKSTEPRRRLHSKRSSSSLSPDSYYYYSGFGPRWGKKRGQKRSVAPDRTLASNVNDKVNNVEHLKPIQESSPSRQIDNGEFNYVEDKDKDKDENEDGDGESGKKRARKPIKARSLKSLM